MMKLPEELMFIRNSRLTQKKTEESMKGKLTVISGATSGVGLSALKNIASAGSDIVLVCRNIDKAEKIRGEIRKDHPVKVDIVQADFTDLDSVRKAAKEILARYPKIDVLINSVGIHNTTRQFTKDGIEMVFCVNHLSPFLFTLHLLKRMKESAPSRIIQVNSEGHRFNGLNIKDVSFRRRIYTGLRGYGQSKTAQLYTVWELAHRLEGTGVTINAVHPGAVKTNIGNNNGWLYRWFLHHVTWHFLKDPDIAGKALYYHAASKEQEGVSGKFFNLTIEEKPARHAIRKGPLQAQIWNLSLRMTGMKESDI